MFHYWNKLSEQNKGIILVALGAILLLHTLGIFTTGLRWVLIFGSVFMIGLGLMKLDVQNKIMGYFKK
jgi:hypothetical protein